MKIGIFFDDGGYAGRDLSTPSSGNPGIGGTEYCIVMLMHYLSMDTKYEVICYHLNRNQLPPKVKDRLVESQIKAVEAAAWEHVDVLITNRPLEKQVFDAIDHYQVKTISWAHNYLIGELIKLHEQSRYIKRVVFVGRQVYDRYIDCPLIRKADYIFNMVPSQPGRKRIPQPGNTVTYTGSLIYDKGFHILAKSWKSVLRQVPDAQLHVIGSAKVYDEGSTVGSYGIADPEYEKLFMPYLTDEAGRILPSVLFHGALGAEKNEIYEITKVGVMNPSSRTETFGLSGVEMSLLGIPVCAGGRNGLLDTVVHGQTGLTSNSAGKLSKNIVTLLKDNHLNNTMGENGMEYAQRFAPEKIILDWKRVIDEVYSDVEPTYHKPENHYFNNMKWVRILNRSIWRLVGTERWFGVVDLEGAGRSILRKLLRKG